METGLPSRRRLAWPIGIVLAFVIILAVNALFIYLAVSGADEIAPSYQTEQR